MTTQDLIYTPEDTSEYAGVIYALHTGDHEYRYVGKTTQALKVRFGQHLTAARAGRPWAVSKWIMKHGPENIRVCVLATFDKTSIEWIDDRETFYIAQYRDLIEKENLNLTDGGDGSAGYKHTPETLAKLSAAKKGKKYTLGMKYSTETRAKMSAAKKGIPSPNAHIRYHVNKGTYKDGCSWCEEEMMFVTVLM